MDVVILAAGIGSRLSKYTHDQIPKYLINLDDNTGLYYIINYWKKYAKNIYLVINSKYNNITNFYITNILTDININIINYDTNDGTAYTLNIILKKLDPKHLLITWCDLYPIDDIDFNKMDESSDIYVITNGNKCRYLLNDNNEIICRDNEVDGNIVGIYYFHNFKKFNLDNSCNDIVSYLHKLGNIKRLEINNIVDYGDEDKLLHILNLNKSISLSLKCRYFNSLTIYDDKLLKKAVNDKGKYIIKFEKEWYRYVYNLNLPDINKLIPKIYSIFEHGYLMEYKKGYTPVHKNINPNIFQNIIKNIEKIHNIEKKDISKNIFISNLKKEICDKPYARKNIINNFLNYFGDIHTVNDVKIDTFDNIMNKCKDIILNYYLEKNYFEYSIILGDCQFSNILSCEEDIIFIDPRGYFGDSQIYGPVEYDYAKILYALSGYDKFNYEYFNISHINDGCLYFKIDNMMNLSETEFFKFENIHRAFLVIIWLSLAEYNKNNIWKCLASYYHGLYLGTLLSST